MSNRRVISGCMAAHPEQRGGQHVAKPCMGVLVIDDDHHIGVFIGTERSQHANKELADKVVTMLIATKVLT